MMLNQSAEHALRAVLFIARRPDEEPNTVARIADALSIPEPYLAKVLTALTRAQVVRATRGRRGGYRLASSPDSISIEDVIQPFQVVDADARCLLGDRSCDRGSPCAAHRRWHRMQLRVDQFMRCTTVAALVRSEVDQGS